MNANVNAEDATSTASSADSSTDPIVYGITTDFELAWKTSLKRPIARLSGLEDGGDEAFLGPYSMSISPDEDYAMITARGIRTIGQFDPALGHKPDPDESVGGILVIDLQANEDGHYPNFHT